MVDVDVPLAQCERIRYNQANKYNPIETLALHTVTESQSPFVVQVLVTM